MLWENIKKETGDKRQQKRAYPPHSFSPLLITVRIFSHRYENE